MQKRGAQNPGELRAANVGRILICCDLNDSEPEGSSYRQLVFNHHKVLPALTTLYNVHQYILHYIK
jgi:hypothetical protein